MNGDVVLGGPACVKNIINQMVAAMALGSDAALVSASNPEGLREELQAADLEYLSTCIKIWDKYGVPLPISVTTRTA